MNQYAAYRRQGIPLRNAVVAPEQSGPFWDVFLKLESQLSKGTMIGLIGKRGVGKTQLGVELVKKHGGRFATAVSIAMALRPIDKAEQVMEELSETSLLVIDEVFKKQETEWAAAMFYELLNRRHGGMKDTILIDNFDEAGFEAAAGDSLVSRINESGGVIVCDWPDYRQCPRKAEKAVLESAMAGYFPSTYLPPRSAEELRAAAEALE